MVAAVAAPVVKIGSQSVAAVVAVVVAAAAAVVAVAAGTELEAPWASAGMRLLSKLTTNAMSVFATNFNGTELATTGATASSLTGGLRTRRWSARRVFDHACKTLVVVTFKRPRRPPPGELNLSHLPQSQARASAGELPKSTAPPHWSLATACVTSSSTVGFAVGC